MRHYILDDSKRAVPVELLEWAEWYQTADRRVGDTMVGDVRISTVFLGSDHNWWGGKPLVFETMVFGGEFDQEMERYSTWDEAVAGHKEMVQRIEEVQ